MVKIPVKFTRVAAVFDEAARGWRMCESSGSEHSAVEESSPDNLSDLVASFMEKDGNATELLSDEEETEKCSVEEPWRSDYDETADTLRDLLGCNSSVDGAKEAIRVEVELACRSIGNEYEYEYSSGGFKRRLMSHLRERGLDAGMCKSRWEKSGKRPAGDYQYVDIVDADGARYIVEVRLAACFEIARPTNRYASLLSLFPFTFVGRPEELKQVVRLMCGAMRESLNSSELTLPPWRRNAYMQSKWLGSHKRTTNKTPTSKASESNSEEGSSGKVKLIRFAVVPRGPYHCRDDCSVDTRARIGQLTAAFCHNGRV